MKLQQPKSASFAVLKKYKDIEETDELSGLGDLEDDKRYWSGQFYKLRWSLITENSEGNLACYIFHISSDNEPEIIITVSNTTKDGYQKLEHQSIFQ